MAAESLGVADLGTNERRERERELHLEVTKCTR